MKKFKKEFSLDLLVVSIVFVIILATYIFAIFSSKSIPNDGSNDSTSLIASFLGFLVFGSLANFYVPAFLIVALQNTLFISIARLLQIGIVTNSRIIVGIILKIMIVIGNIIICIGMYPKVINNLTNKPVEIEITNIFAYITIVLSTIFLLVTLIKQLPKFKLAKK